MKKNIFKKKRHHLIILIIFFLAIIVIQYGTKKITLEKIHLSIDLILIPYYAFCSFYRMLGAYILSFFFSFTYGYLSATNKSLSKFTLPALDILQSIPVLGFFPAVLFFFVNLSGGSRIGVEMASIFLIFTGQAWNIAFGVYEAISTIPEDSKEAVDSLGIKGFKKLKLLYFPASIPKIIYNSIISWGGGWYFLIACEIITIGPINYKLPGLGSFLIESTQQGEWLKSLLGLLMLIFIIIMMHFFIWHPLSTWAEKFRYEFFVSSTNQESFLLNWGKTTPRGKKIRKFFEKMSRKFLTEIEKWENKIKRIKSKIKLGQEKEVLKKTGIVIFWVFCFWLSLKGIISLATMISKPWPEEVNLIPLSLLTSLFRLTVAYLIALCWTVPLAIWAGENKRVADILTPLAQIGAGVPATALFPFIVMIVINFFGMINIATILLILMGMQWYLLFNLIGGVNTIPGELKEAAKSLGLSRWQYWTKLVLPAIYPSLLTGSITAWGGGWNSLIVSEYLVYNKKVYSVTGIGALLDKATYVMGNNTLIFLTLISMVSLIVFLNHFFWRKLYNAAIRKYKIDY